VVRYRGFLRIHRRKADEIAIKSDGTYYHSRTIRVRAHIIMVGIKRWSYIISIRYPHRNSMQRARILW